MLREKANSSWEDSSRPKSRDVVPGDVAQTFTWFTYVYDRPGRIVRKLSGNYHSDDRAVAFLQVEKGGVMTVLATIPSLGCAFVMYGHVLGWIPMDDMVPA